MQNNRQIKNRLSALLFLSLFITTSCDKNNIDEMTNGNPPDISPVNFGESYQVQPFTTQPDITVAPLYAYSIPVPSSIHDKMEDSYPGIDCGNAIFSFTESSTTGFWFPVMAQGKVINVISANLSENDTVGISHTMSDVEALNTLAPLTSADTPLLLVPTEYFVYYIIGDTAYVEQQYYDTWQLSDTYVGDFTIPDVEFRIVNPN